MPELQEPNLGLGYGFNLGEDGWKNSNDRTMIVAGALAQGFVLNDVLLAEPVSPAVGDAYILPTGVKTGVNWGTDTGAVTDAVAIFTNIPGQVDSSPWYYVTPKEGWMLFERTSNHYQIFNGTAWNSPLTVPQLIVTADIVTATPPTTEAVTAQLKFFDADNTDEIGFIGFQGSAILRLKNRMHGGPVEILGEDAAGVSRNIFTGDPDGASQMYNAGVLRLIAGSSFAMVRGTIAAATPPTTELVNGSYRIFDSDGTDLVALFGHDGGSNILQIQNRMHGGAVLLSGERASDGAVRNIVQGDPDTNVDLYNPADNAIRMQMQSGGIVRSLGDINTATPPVGEAVTAQTKFYDAQNANELGSVGYQASNILALTNRMHGGPIRLGGEDVAGVFRTIFEGDPDGCAAIYFAGLIRARSDANAFTIRSDGNVDTENRRLDFAHQDGTLRADVGYNGSNTFEIVNRIHGAAIKIAGEDAGGVERIIVNADPDLTTILRADTDLILQADAGVVAVKYSGLSSHVIVDSEAHTGITASTTQTQGQGQLLSSHNEVATVANANDTVTAPVAVAGRTLTILNNGANTLQVFPSTGDDLGAGVNTAITIVAGGKRWWFAYDATVYTQFV